MTQSSDVHLRSDGSIDIDHYRRAAARERAKALRHAHVRLDQALAAVVRGARDLLSRRPVPSPAGR